MPLITRRSSTRSTPRTSVGKWGLIRDHCSSLSQNKFLRTIPIPSKFESESYCQCAELMSSDPSTFLGGYASVSWMFNVFTAIACLRSVFDFPSKMAVVRRANQHFGVACNTYRRLQPFA